MEDKKSKVIQVKELVIHADEVHIINPQAAHESPKAIETDVIVKDEKNLDTKEMDKKNVDTKESHKRSSWDWFWGNRNRH